MIERPTAGPGGAARLATTATPIPALVLAALVALPSAEAVAQSDSGIRPVTSLRLPAPVPFGPGERLEYDVKLGAFRVGEGHLAVLGVETIRGHRAYHTQMVIRGGIPLARVDDSYDSWLDVHDLYSHRFIQDIDEVGYSSFRYFEMHPDRMVWENTDDDVSGPLASPQPLDDISFVYMVRTLPLNVGDTYTINRYFKEDGNPVRIHVVRRDTVRVPAGTFRTIVVRPVIQTDGLFGEGGEAELHFTDDARRLLVYMRSNVPVVGSISLHLKNIREGTPMRSGGE